MNEELLTDFLEESYDLIEKVKTTLQHWQSQENKEEAVNSVYRWIHTIKGGCSMFNYNHTAKLAHELETYLGKLKEAKGVVKQDELNRVSSELTVIENLLRNGDQLSAGVEVSLPVVTEAKKELKFTTEYFQDYFNSSSHLLEDLYKDGYVFFEMVLPREMSSKLIDKLNEHGFITISNEEVSAGVACLCSLNKNEGEYQLKKARQLIERFHGRWCSEEESQKPVEQQPVNTLPETTPAATGAPVQTQEVLRVPLVTVNGILDHVWELFLVRNQMAHLFRENSHIFRDQHSFIQQFEALDTILERNIHELEGKTMSLRLSPLKKVFDRMKKVVADYCAQNGKKINFITKGEGIDLDKKVLDLLNEPLIHLVRNAIDHGVEKAEERRLAGKEETGNVCLSAQIQGNEVLITLSDDGKGINPAKILESARKKNMDVSHLKDDQEIINLIFAAGFSTAEQLTAVSGRGVGMDAVKKSIHELGGDVGLSTKVGQGTTFSITLPLSMSVSKSLVVKVRDLLYAIPTKSIIFVEKISVHSLSKNGKDEFYRFNDELIPCYDISRLFPDYRAERELPIISTHVCVTTVNGQHMALRVDEVVQTLSMVMKPLSRSIRKSPLLSGVSLLPNGSPIFVLNIHECILMLLNHTRGDDHVRKSA